MRVLALHADVLVFVSAVWQTSATAVRSGSGEEGFLIDSPVYPDELEAVPNVLEQAGFPVSGLLATHGDWDHLLGRSAFPEASLGVPESTLRRLAETPDEPDRELQEFDQEHYVERPGPLSLGDLQGLPVPGKLEIGSERDLELHPTPGHTVDGMAVVIPWASVLVCGDYLSPVELPMIAAVRGSVETYRATLERLRPLLARVEHVIPGHGAPLSAGQAEKVLDEDAAYLVALWEDGAQAALPAGRATAEQRRLHAENVKIVSP